LSNTLATQDGRRDDRRPIGDAVRKMSMRGYLVHVLWRTLFVLACLGAGLLGWPGLTGA
jgi:hypothetical protein